MQPGTLSLSLYRGDTYSWRFTLWTDAAKTQPADLTGAVAAAEVRSRPAGDFITRFTCAIELPNVIAMQLTAPSSRQLTERGGVWDLELSYPTGVVATILAGRVTVTMDVTNAIAGSAFGQLQVVAR